MLAPTGASHTRRDELRCRQVEKGPNGCSITLVDVERKE